MTKTLTVRVGAPNRLCGTGIPMRLQRSPARLLKDQPDRESCTYGSVRGREVTRVPTATGGSSSVSLALRRSRGRSRRARSSRGRCISGRRAEPGSRRDHSGMGGIRTGSSRGRFCRGPEFEFRARFAEGNLERLPTMAAELVGMNVDVIVVRGPAPCRSS